MNKSFHKILFIIPPFFNIDDFINNSVNASAPILEIPYGVLSLSAFLKEKLNDTIEINILDLNLEMYKICLNQKATHESININNEIEKLIYNELSTYQPSLIGISALFNTCFKYIGIISDTVKKYNKSIITIIGGGVATNLYKEVLTSFSSLDAACFGEGELPLYELITSENPYIYIDNNTSWITSKKLSTAFSPQSNYINNLDEIPFFDYSLLSMDFYQGRALDKVSNNMIKQLPIHTSRGCPFNCVFCASSSVHGKKVRFMSEDKVISEVETMVNEFNIDTLAIEDDHFFINKDRAKNILKALKKYNLRIEFPNATAVYSIDDDISELLKEAGVTTISLAVESGSEYVLRNIINKPLKTDMIEAAAKSLRKNGINVHANFIIGFPGEQEIHRSETLELIKKTGFDWCYFFIAIPIAGSRLYSICKENGYLVDDHFDNYITSKCNIKTSDIDPEYIEEKAYLMNLEVNFINNYNLASGNYRKASLYFKNIVSKYPDHAFAHFCLAKAYKHLGIEEKAIEFHMNSYKNIIETNPVWSKYAKIFNLV